MKLDELKSCPFCGGEASAEGIGGNNVGCNDAECPGYTTNCSTITWNRRAALPADDALIEKLESTKIPLSTETNTAQMYMVNRTIDQCIKIVRQHQSSEGNPKND